MGIYYETTYGSNIEFSIITDKVLIWKDNFLVAIVTKLVSLVGCRWVCESMEEHKDEEKKKGGGEKRELKKGGDMWKKNRRKGKSRKRRGNGGERRKRRRRGR